MLNSYINISIYGQYGPLINIKIRKIIYDNLNNFTMGKNLSNADYLKIRKNIIKRLYSNKSFSKGHLLYERLTSGIPPHLAGFVTRVLDDLVKESLVIHYGRTKYGDAYQLNIQKLKEIENILFGK